MKKRSYGFLLPTITALVICILARFVCFLFAECKKILLCNQENYLEIIKEPVTEVRLERYSAEARK